MPVLLAVVAEVGDMPVAVRSLPLGGLGALMVICAGLGV